MIDTSKWKEFVLGELFEIKSPSARSEKNYDEGKINYVSSGCFNNGVANRLKPKPDEKLDKGHCITVSPLDGSSFWQEDDFMGRGGSGASISMLYNDNLTELNALFICSIIRNTAQKFGYADLLNGKNLKTLQLMLPATPEGEPDWNYMESYMKKVMQEAEDYLEIVGGRSSEKKLIDVSGWGEFKIKDLFDVIKGTRLTRADMKDGAIKFIGSSAMNNGETHRIANNEKLHPANTITVCYNGSIGETFYQDEEFWASDDVNVLYPKFEMNKYHAIFICPIIK